MSGRVARIARRAAAVGGVAVLLALAVWGLERRGTVNAWLTTRIAALLGPRVRFSTARAVWWPRLGVTLDRVALVAADPAAAGGGASATNVTCAVRLAPLLRGRVEIGTVQVEGLQLALEGAPGGALRAGGLETFAAQAPHAPSAGRAPALPAVRVRDGEVEYRDAAGAAPRTLRLRAVNLELVPSGAGARAELTAEVDGGGTLHVRGTLDALADVAVAGYRADVAADALAAPAVLAWLPPPADHVTAEGRLRLTVTLAGHGTADAEGDASLELSDGNLAWAGWQGDAPLRLAAHAAWNGSALTLSRGRIDAARLARDALTADAVEASFAYGDGTVRVETAQLRACGGTWRPTGSVSLSNPPRIDGSLQADGVDATLLADSLRAGGVAAELPRLSAALRLNAQASGEPGGTWTGHAEVATDGALTWSAARLEGPVEIAADVQANAAAVELSNGRARARRVAFGRFALDGLESGFAYARGAARVTPLRAAACGGAWTYTGTLPLDAGAPWSGDLTGTQVSAAALRDAFSPGGAAGVEGTIDLNARLTGTGTSAVGGSASARLASPSLTWDELRVDAPTTVSGALRLDGARLTLSNGQAQARRVRLRGVEASAISTDFDYRGDTLHVAGVKARAFSGGWHARGSVGLSDTPTWHGSVDAKHVDFAALLHAVDPDSDGPRSVGGVADVSVSVGNAPDGAVHGSVALTLSRGEFIWDDLHVAAPAHASGTFAVRGEAFSLSKVAADAARAAYGPLVGTTATAHLQYSGERLSFDDLRFTACGGTWTHSGWFTLDEGGQFSGQIGIEGAVPRDLARMLANPSFDIPFARIDLDSEFSGHAVPDWLPGLHASGSLYVSDGSIPAATVLRPIWEAIIGPGRMMNAIDRRTTHVAEISDSFTLRRARLHTTDLSITTDDYSVTALGSIGLDGTLDLNARIQLTARGVQNMLVFASMPLPTSALPSLPPIPARVSGVLGNPVIRPNVSALPRSTVAWMVDVLLHAPRTLGSAVLDGVGGLWRRVTGGSATEP